ncbi:MAG: hypothetical protein HC831_07955 [Chloroflexia bacterium]|nr:hypothetical protein [Chloroflexia bacterium]
MSFNKVLIYKLFIATVFLAGAIFLLSGSNYLAWRVNILFGFHVGTVVSWAVLTSASLLAININKHNPRLSFVSSVSFYISIFWLLISFLLAGNSNLVFHSKPMSFNIWLVMSALPVLILVISLVYNLLRFLKLGLYDK